MAGRAFLDTNVLVYLLDRAESRKRGIAADLLRSDAERGDLVLSTQVLQEFYVTITGKFRRPVPHEAALESLERFSEFPVVVVTPPLVLKAARRHRKDRIAFWDALIVEAALSADCERLLSEDFQEGRVFDGMRVENPFAA